MSYLPLSLSPPTFFFNLPVAHITPSPFFSSYFSLTPHKMAPFYSPPHPLCHILRHIIFTESFPRAYSPSHPPPTSSSPHSLRIIFSSLTSPSHPPCLIPRPILTTLSPPPHPPLPILPASSSPPYPTLSIIPSSSSRSNFHASSSPTFSSATLSPPHHPRLILPTPPSFTNHSLLPSLPRRLPLIAVPTKVILTTITFITISTSHLFIPQHYYRFLSSPLIHLGYSPFPPSVTLTSTVSIVIGKHELRFRASVHIHSHLHSSPQF